MLVTSIFSFPTMFSKPSNGASRVMKTRDCLGKCQHNSCWIVDEYALYGSLRNI